MNAQPNAGSNHREHYPAEVRKLFRVGTHASFRQGFRSLPAKWLQNKAIHFPIDRWSSVAALEDSTRCSIAKIRLNDRHCAGIYVHFSMARFSLRGHFLVNECGPSDVNDELREVQILNVKTSDLSESHACCKLQCE